jgi:hypothetical protein
MDPNLNIVVGVVDIVVVTSKTTLVLTLLEIVNRFEKRIHWVA